MPKNTSLNRGGAWLLAVACAVSAGCGDETGILVEVTRDQATTSDSIEELRFFIGTRSGAGVFVEDDDPLQTVELPGGRDLFADPYRLLLREGGEGGNGDADADVMVAVIGYVDGEVHAFGAFDTSVHFEAGKVLQWPVVLQGRADVPVTDTGCLVFDGGKIAPTDDRDCDGDRPPADCNDLDPDVGPSSPELCGNGADDNCDGRKDEEVDDDGDGFTNCEECDDADELVNPNAQEVCDGIDNDCDGTCDAEFDKDDDEYSTCGSKVIEDGLDCFEPTPERIDCDDTRDDVFPGAEERCDGADNDCNDICDDGFDPDGDTYTECGSNIDKCDGIRPEFEDCEPEDGAIHPRAPELCNGFDDNCDEIPYPESTPCYAVGVTEGGSEVCVVGTRSCDDVSDGEGWGECVIEGRVNDETFHAPFELCAAYEECDAAGSPNPFECAGAAAADAAVSCTVYVADPAEGVLCPNTAVPVPVVDKLGCSWSILGGKLQRHFEVGLSLLTGVDIPPDGPVDAAVDGCAIWFQVIKAHDAPPQHDSVLLWHRDTGNPAGILIEVQLSPVPASPCPEVGLECSGFPDLSPAG